jgi:hypothetical protein
VAVPLRTESATSAEVTIFFMVISFVIGAPRLLALIWPLSCAQEDALTQR